MNKFIIVGIIFIPFYIFYNAICLKRKKVSIWINNSRLKVIKNDFFNFQFKASLITCIVLSILIIISTIYKISEGSLPLIIVFFTLSNIITRAFALKKGYIELV